MEKLAAWVVSLGISFAFVKLTAIGPVILVISESRGWGVHVGDLLTLLLLLPMAAWSVREVGNNTREL